MIFLTLLFLIAVAFDISPYLRGPAEWPPDWRWPYLFVNTIDKIWLPLIIIALILSAFYLIDKIKKVSLSALFGLVILAFLFQLSILFFSRSGIGVLIHRIINPDLNGYFTEAIKINDLFSFMANYRESVLNFSMHATGHPPGSILFFWFIERIFDLFPFVNGLTAGIVPKHADVQLIWNGLNLTQKSAAVFSAFFIPFLGSLNILPLFYLAKHLYDVKTAIRSVFLVVFLPALTLFIPLNDVFFPMFFLWSFLFYVKGIKNENFILIIISGLIFSLGLFFSLSLLPLLLIYFFYVFSSSKRKSGFILKIFFIFITGLAVFYLILFFGFRFNFLTVSYTLMTGLPKGRQYLTWVFYNYYDFFIFAGIPISLIYLKIFFQKSKSWLFYSFTIMLFLLNFTGVVKGEVGRIWLPLMFPFIIIVSNYLTKITKVSTTNFLLILFLQGLQIIVLQEFWVTLW